MNKTIDRRGRLSGGGRRGYAVTAGEFTLQFGLPHLQHLRRAIQDLSAQIGALFRPVREGAAGGEDRVAKIFFGSARKIRQDVALPGWRRHDAPVFAADEFSADKELVCLLDLQP